jgi:hypothetical protein
MFEVSSPVGDSSMADSQPQALSSGAAGTTGSSGGGGGGGGGGKRSGIEELEVVRSQVESLLTATSTRKSEQKDALGVVKGRLESLTERQREEVSVRREQRRKAALAMRLQAIAEGKLDDVDNAVKAHSKTERRKAKQRRRQQEQDELHGGGGGGGGGTTTSGTDGTSGGRQRQTAAQIAASMVGTNQAEMTAKVFAGGGLTVARGAADSGDEDFLEDDRCVARAAVMGW